jgi:hypothetical protein
MDRPLASLTQIHIEPKWIGRATEPWRHCKAGGQAKENSAACHDSQVKANGLSSGGNPCAHLWNHPLLNGHAFWDGAKREGKTTTKKKKNLKKQITHSKQKVALK